MKTSLITFILFQSLLAFADLGGKEGHGGDPLVVDFFKRAQFILSIMRYNLPLKRQYIEEFAVAFSELRVDITDANLPTVGRVLSDPEKPGKYFVLLDRKKYLESIEKRVNFDLNGFVAHEVFETRMLDLSPEYSITKHLHFLEEDYLHWRDGYRYKSVSVNSMDRFGAIGYSFNTGKYSLAWNALTPSDAEERAMASCPLSDCIVLSWVRNGCLALAASKENVPVIGLRFSVSRSQAEKEALNNCESKSEGVKCINLDSVCTDLSKP